ncbi:MAG: two-component regulator propeller domain-containing protein [Flammeovirgaceae bacterium]
MKHLISFLFCVFSIQLSISLAQEIATGEWRTHFSYYPLQKIALNNESVFCASQNALFVYHLEDKSITTLSKLDDLSDTSISAINYHPAFETLIIAYQNGNIDLWKENEIINIRTILNAKIETKKIHHIFVTEKYAYLSGEYGLAVLDLNKKQLLETYTNIGEDGAKVKVYSSVVANDSIYVASSVGILAASNNNNINRLDFANWKAIFPNVGNNLQHIAALKEKIYFTIENDALYRYQKGVIQKLNLASGQSYKGLYAQKDEKIYFFTNDSFYTIDDNGTIVRILESVLKAPRQAVISNDQMFVADEKRGLVVQKGNANPEFVFLNGVYSPIISQLYFNQNINEGQIIALSNDASFNVFEKGVWTNYVGEENFFNAQNIPAINKISSFTNSASSSKNYFGSWGGGVLEWDNQNNAFKIINEGFALDGQGEILVSNVLADESGKLWSLRFGEKGGIYQRLNDNWQKISFSNNIVQYLTQIIEDETGQKWCVVDARAGGGIFVFENSNKFKLLSDEENNGNLPSMGVNVLTKDKKGSIWVGTNKGVTEFFNPSDILTTNASDAVEPRYQNRKLLQDEVINTIAVDGGNRKWIGTNNGVWLFSADASELIHHFTSKNSPLPSDNVVSVAIHGNTGEVFVATDEGMVSYRSDATNSESTHQNVKVFPNPVKAGFSGYITIQGLAENAIVKITDINGRTVWQTKSNGGTAVWNGRDNDGKKAKSGVYLVFSSTEDGEDAYVTKIAVLN